MNIQELQDKVAKRNNAQWNKSHKKLLRKYKAKEPAHIKSAWKELYQDFN